MMRCCTYLMDHPSSATQELDSDGALSLCSRKRRLVSSWLSYTRLSLANRNENDVLKFKLSNGSRKMLGYGFNAVTVKMELFE